MGLVRDEVGNWCFSLGADGILQSFRSRFGLLSDRELIDRKAEGSAATL